MALNFRTTDTVSSRWVSTSGVRLTAAQVDYNIWYLNDRINSISSTPGRGIDHMSVSGTTLTVYFTDATTQTFTLPTAASWNPTGAYVASTSYHKYDVLYSGMGVYLVLQDHTAPSTFTPGLTVGGLPAYAAIWVTSAQSMLRSSVAGTAYTLALADNWTHMDFTNSAGCAVTVPPNASVGFAANATQIMIRQGGTSPVTFVAGAGVTINVPANRIAASKRPGDIVWLVKVATDTWTLSGDLDTSTAIIAESDVIGLVTDLAAKLSVTAAAATYAPIAAGIPVGGSAKQVLGKVSGTNYDVAWISREPTWTSQSLATYAPLLADEWKLLNNDNMAGCVVTLPSDATQAFAIGSIILFRQDSDVKTTFVADTGAVINLPYYMGAETRGFGSIVWAIKTLSNTWDLFGELGRATKALTTTGTVAISPADGDGTVTPTGNITFNMSSVRKGEWSLFVTTSGTSSFNITFGANFVSQGVLATGTVSGKKFAVKFWCDGTTFWEISRTVAM